MEEKLSRLQELIGKEDADAGALKTATEELEQAAHGIAQKMYEQAAQAQQGAGGEGEAAPEGSADDDEGVIDAEFEAKS